MTSALRFLSCKGLNILEQLHLEEVILRKSTENVCLFNVGSPTSIVVGYSGKIPELLNVNEVFTRQTPIIRRYTGGGTVIVDKNTIFVTLILNVRIGFYYMSDMTTSNWSQFSHCQLLNDD